MTPTPVRLLPSFIDRLLDPDSMGGRLAGYDPRQMAAAVRADLEQLLNTRRPEAAVPPEFAETARSVAAYGLPDLSGYDPTALGQRGDLARLLAQLIARFEPRLRNVHVTIPDDSGRGLALLFRVSAELNVDPAPEVGFETVLELTTGRVTVSAPGGVG